jgi:hypothetical protein
MKIASRSKWVLLTYPLLNDVRDKCLADDKLTASLQVNNIPIFARLGEETLSFEHD